MSFETIDKKICIFLSGGVPRTYYTYYNMSSYVLSNGDANTSNSYQGMDSNHYLRGLNTKDGVQHASFENIDKKFAFFPFWVVREHTIPITMCQSMYYPMEMLTLQTLTKEWTQITI